jgi:two-component system, LuxR family, sensor kinase FixL
MIAVFLTAGRIKTLIAVAAMIALIAVADWSIGSRASLGVLYILPMMLGAIVLAPWQTTVLALICSSLRSWFDIPSPHIEMLLRFIFASLTYAGSGLFVTALIRNRSLEEQLKLLVESSPAAILTTDGFGKVLAANHAANSLFLKAKRETLKGEKISHYVPLLGDALKLADRPEHFRTATQCQGRKDNGEIFLAQIWFSSYLTPEGPRLAAIVVDASEEMRDREEEGLRQLMIGNRIAAAAVSHEVRNLCSAISVLCSNIRAKHVFAQDDDLQGLATLVQGLERIASWQLQSNLHDNLEEIPLQEVMDDLRIVIEPHWRDMNGKIIWFVPPKMPVVLAERHGLLQAFLNLAQNSHRAVQGGPVRELLIDVSVQGRMANISFQDTGPGVADAARLFAPFQPGADGTGLGLYVSRAVIRNYGGELRYEPHTGGACFRVEIPVV